jgi:DNA polymerase III epsilon subunit-like protein
MAAACAVDVETTGLDPGRHVAWDIAVVASLPDGGKTAHQWFIKPELANADPFALKVGKYYERTADLLAAGSRKQGGKWSDPVKAAAELARLLNGATLIGHNPWFDASFLAAFLRRHGQLLTADYHYVDTGTLVTGYITGLRHGYQDFAKLPPDRVLVRYPAPKGSHLADMAAAVGIDPQRYEQHTALGDARLAMAIYERVMGGAP